MMLNVATVHYVHVKLKENLPIPPIVCIWNDHREPHAEECKLVLNGRIIQWISMCPIDVATWDM